MPGGSFLCEGCAGKGDVRVDLDVQGSCPLVTLDSFRQTRGYRIENLQDYPSTQEMAEMSARALRYYDPETGDYYEKEGDIDAALLGIACAERWLASRCPKSESEILTESQIS